MACDVISIEFPTKYDDEVERVARLIDESNGGVVACLSVDGAIGEALIHKWGGKVPGLNFVLVEFDGIISMTRLRMEAMRAACDLGTSGWSLVTDGDVIYKKGWHEFALETMRMFPEAPAWCNFRGTFGSSGPGDRLLVPRQLPLGSNNGIMLNSSARAAILAEPPPELPGGCEDPLLTAWLTLKNGCIPLRRFKMPAHHKKKASEHYAGSLIHNKEIMAENNFKLIRELWEEAGCSGRWGGIPDNFDQVGKRLPDGSVLSPYAPKSDKWVMNMVKCRANQGLDLKPYINW